MHRPARALPGLVNSEGARVAALTRGFHDAQGLDNPAFAARGCWGQAARRGLLRASIRTPAGFAPPVRAPGIRPIMAAMPAMLNTITPTAATSMSV